MMFLHQTKGDFMIATYVLYIWLTVSSGVVTNHKSGITTSFKPTTTVMALDFYTQSACEAEVEKIISKNEHDVVKVFCVKERN
jgi:hypothetical protein